MPVLIDTDVAIELMRLNPYTLDCIAKHEDSVFVSTITSAELYFGAYNSARPEQNALKVKAFLRNFPRVTIDDETARRYGLLKVNLRRRSVQVAPFDLMIATLALANGCVVATGNIRHFNRIDGLQIVDWVRP